MHNRQKHRLENRCLFPSIYNMKNHHSGLVWAAGPVFEKNVWGRLSATFEGGFFTFSWAKRKLKTLQRRHWKVAQNKGNFFVFCFFRFLGFYVSVKFLQATVESKFQCKYIKVCSLICGQKELGNTYQSYYPIPPTYVL